MNDKRTDILNATLNLISNQGFHGTPMSQIANQAGVGAGTIYRYFENKETLINELFLEIKREFSQAMMAGFESQDGTEQIFRQIWLNTFNFCIQFPQKMVFLEQFHNSPYQTAETEAATFAFVAPLIEIFQSAIEAGEIKNIPFEMLTTFAYDITIAIAKRHIAGTLKLDETHLAMAVEACWDAVKNS